jgi:hypothetical protein
MAVLVWVALVKGAAADTDAMPTEINGLEKLTRGFVDQFGHQGAWLEMPKLGGPIKEYRMLGTGWRITNCKGSWIVETNFQTQDGREVLGNFLILPTLGQNAVQGLSFGYDESLRWYRGATHEIYYSGVSLLRLDPVE